MNLSAVGQAGRGRREAGFVMVEAVIAIALIAVGVGTVMGAILAVAHQTATARPTSALTLSAQNVLTDLRAATAYDGAQLTALEGRSTAFDVSETGPDGSPQPLHVVATITRSASSGETIAAVTVTNPKGQTVTVQSTLVQEAPAPGSTVSADAANAADAAPAAEPTAGSASPSPAPEGDADRAPGRIAL